MKYIRLFKDKSSYSEVSSNLPYPCLAMLEDSKDGFLFEQEPSYVKCTYEIPQEAFEYYGTSAITIMNSASTVAKDYKLNGVNVPSEPIKIEEGVAINVWEWQTINGEQGYAPTLEAMPIGSELTTQTIFTLSRPLKETDYFILLVGYEGELMPGGLGQVSDLMEEGMLEEAFTFLSDTEYHYSEAFLEQLMQEEEFMVMNFGIFFINQEWIDDPTIEPTLTTTMIGRKITGGIGDITVDASMLDENNLVTIEYRLNDDIDTISSRFNHQLLRTLELTTLSPKKKYSIGISAFAANEALINVDLGDSINKINASAFYNCKNLQSIKIGKNVKHLDISAFDNTDNLHELVISEKNRYYDSRENCNAIIESKHNKMIYVTNNTTFIPNTVTELSDGLFSGKTITSVVIPDSITYLNDNLFYNCKNLESVTLPNTIESIGKNAFYYCEKLNGIELHDGLKTIGNDAFNYCQSLSSIVIPNTVTEVGSRCFYNCSTMETIVLSNQLTILNQYTFTNCSGLTSIDIPENVITIDYECFWNCVNLQSVTLHENLTTLGNYAFENCKSLTTINLPESLTTIGKYTFDGCTNVTDWHFGKNITSLSFSTNLNGCNGNVYLDCYCEVPTTSSNGFMNHINHLQIGPNAKFSDHRMISFIAKSIDSVTIDADNTQWWDGDGLNIILNKDKWCCYRVTKGFQGTLPQSIQQIYNICFMNSDVTSVHLPYFVSDVAGTAFRDCYTITSLTVDTKNSFIDSRDNCNAIIRKSDNKLIAGCNISTVPSTCECIGPYAFWMNTAISSVNIPSSCKTIELGAFSGCTSLTSVTIEEGLETIGNSVFSNCTSLSVLNIPASVNSLGSNVVFNCTSLPVYGGLRYAEGWLCGCVNYTLSEYEIRPNTYWYSTGVFQSCRNMKKITLRSNGYKGMCSGCTSLTDAVYSDEATLARESMFSGCTNLSSVTLGANIEAVENKVFYNNTKLNTIYSYAVEAPSLNSGAFTNVMSNGTLYYPKGNDYSTWLTALGDGWVGVEMEF